MRRREFMGLLGGAAVSWPLSARAQQPAMPVIGFLSGASPNGYENIVAAFRRGLKESGLVEGQNAAIDFRWAEGHYDRLPEMAADLVRQQVAVIVANPPAVPAAKAATTTIPIVFITGSDPVASGLVARLNRPGGNLTGISLISDEFGAKQLGLLRELVPAESLIAFLVNPASPTAEANVRDIKEAAATIRQPVQILNASSAADIDAAFATLAQTRAAALIIVADALFVGRREQLVTLAARQSMPTIYPFGEFASAGGLLSYGASRVDAYRLAGGYTGRILKGERPADLPIMRPTKFELAVNLKTARTLGLTVPAGVLAIADEVIE